MIACQFVALGLLVAFAIASFLVVEFQPSVQSYASPGILILTLGVILVMGVSLVRTSNQRPQEDGLPPGGTKETLEQETQDRVRDLTAANERLREAEAKWRSLAEDVQEMILSLDREGTIQFANPVLANLTGEDVVGKQVYGYLPPEHHDRLREALEHVFRTSETVSFEVMAPGPHDRPAWYAWEVCPRRREGEVTAATVVSRNVTAERRAAEERKESEERFRQLADTMPVVFWICDLPSNRILYVSPGYETIWGRTCESLCTDPESLRNSAHPEDRSRLAEALEGRAKGSYDVEYRIRRPDGSVRWIWDQGFPIRNEKGEVCRMVGIAQDVTERLTVEAFLELDTGRVEIFPGPG